MCTPCFPGFRFKMLPATWTSSPFFMKNTKPVTFVSDLGSSCACAAFGSSALATHTSAQKVMRKRIVFIPRTYRRSAGRKVSIKQTLLDSGVSIHAPVAEKRPMRAKLVHPRPIDFADHNRSEEHTSELQSHSFISYAVFA